MAFKQIAISLVLMNLNRRVASCVVETIPFRGIYTQFFVVDESFSPRHDFEPLALTSGVCLLLHTVSGEASLTAEGITYRLIPGSVVLVGGNAHYSQTAGPRLWAVRYLMVRGLWNEALDGALADRRSRVCLLGHASRPVAQLLDEVVDLALNQPRAWEWDCVTRMSEMLKQIRFGDRAPGADDQLISTVAALIDASPDRPWSIIGVARELRIPLSTLRRRFSHETGTSLARWMRNVRMNRARLLLNQGMSVVSIAEQMNFSSPFHLSRSFKTWAGHSPSVEMKVFPSHVATLLR